MFNGLVPKLAKAKIEAARTHIALNHASKLLGFADALLHQYMEYLKNVWTMSQNHFVLEITYQLPVANVVNIKSGQIGFQKVMFKK